MSTSFPTSLVGRATSDPYGNQGLSYLLNHNPLGVALPVCFRVSWLCPVPHVTG